MFLLLELFKVVFLVLVLTQAKIVPSSYDQYTKCLDADWVSQMKQKYPNAGTLDENKLIKHEYIKQALAKPIFKFQDERLGNDSKVYGTDCLDSEIMKFIGSGALIDTNGTVVFPGSHEGSIVLEIGNWDSVNLVSWIATILLEEVVGYEVTHLLIEGGTFDSVERMHNTKKRGLCSPVNVCLETWTSNSDFHHLQNGPYTAGNIGYTARSGLYTGLKFSKQVENSTSATSLNLHKRYYADFWKDYRYEDELINLFPLGGLKNSSQYKWKKNVKSSCPDGILGCLNDCSKSKECSKRESLGKSCIVVTMMEYSWEPGTLQSILSNIGIPAYFCFLGYNASEIYAVESVSMGRPVLFYHWEPDLFHVKNVNKFVRVALPASNEGRFAKNTKSFGEYGYGNGTKNPVDVDMPIVPLLKWSSSSVLADKRVSSFINRLHFKRTDLDFVMASYLNISENKTVTDQQYYSTAACAWIKKNYEKWESWVDKLPRCNSEHYSLNVKGCDKNESTGINRHRIIEFSWIKPRPENSSFSLQCQGGQQAPVRFTLATSRSCNWLHQNQDIWRSWLWKLPTCTPSFYGVNISKCSSTSERKITFFWLLRSPGKVKSSSECISKDPLPSPKSIPCDYISLTYSGYYVMMFVSFAFGGFVVLIMMYMFSRRNETIFRRSQYQLLEVMCFGALLMFSDAYFQAGPPSMLKCAFRPILLVSGFDLIFGSLLLKSFRVYVICTYAARMLRHRIWPVSEMLFYLLLIVVVDYGIIAAWYILDFPKNVVVKQHHDGIGIIEHMYCSSTGKGFQILLFFTKFVLLASGSYFSFHIRNLKSDFQETNTIFWSMKTVTMIFLILLPLNYGMDLEVRKLYGFQVAVKNITSFIVVLIMTVPKMMKTASVNPLFEDSTEPDNKVVF